MVNHQISFLFWLHKTEKDWGRKSQTMANEETKVMKDTEAFSTSVQIYPEERSPSFCPTIPIFPIQP